MNEQMPSMILTPADFADTGQWRLIIYISRHGMSAILQHIADPTRPLVQLFTEKWSGDHPLLEEIERSIYDHPSLLDDYATDIILQAPLLTWIPASMLRHEDYSERRIFDQIYPGIITVEDEETGDVLTERIGNAVALFTFVPGFESFIARTIPGARLRSHLGVMTATLSGAPEQDNPGSTTPYRIYAGISGEGCDIIAMEGKNLLSATSVPFTDPEKIASRIGDLLDIYGIAPPEVTLRLRGEIGIADAVAAVLSERCRIVRASGEAAGDGAALPAAMAMMVGLEKG